ncbi:MAG: hypothetical protein ACFFA4_01500 [Promethearchaeota archaeon]
MPDITDEEKFIIEKLKQKGGKMNYKELKILCENQFEGVRIILKKLKDKGIVDYEGMIPGFSAEIELIKENS